MTDEKDKAAPGAGLGAGSGKKSKVMLIVAAILVALLLGGGLALWQIFFAAPDETGAGPTPRARDKSSDTGFGQIYSLETFVVNLNETGGKRYLKTTIELEYMEAAVKEELDGRLPQMRDTIILLLSSKSLLDVESVEGKIALRYELIMKINALLQKGKIRNLYFTAFVVQ